MKLRDNTRDDSLANRLRQRRLQIFLDLIDGLGRDGEPLRVLDVGGTVSFWERAGVAGRGLDILVLNLEVDASAPRLPGVRQIAGDACDLSGWDEDAFDVVFSNSVIEHVGNWRAQERMAREVRRVGRSYFVQTPNYWFPIEPHFLFPGFQFLPLGARALLLRWLPLAWSGRIRCLSRAREVAAGVRLLTARQMQLLFPDAELVAERIGGLAKSYMAIRRPA